MGEELEFTTRVYDKNVASTKLDNTSKWATLPIKEIEKFDEIDTQYVIDISPQKPIKVVFNNGGGVFAPTSTSNESQIRKESEKNAEKFMDRLIHDLLNKECFDEDKFFSLMDAYDVHLHMISDNTLNDIKSILQDYKDQIQMSFIKCKSFTGLKRANAFYSLHYSLFDFN